MSPDPAVAGVWPLYGLSQEPWPAAPATPGWSPTSRFCCPTRRGSGLAVSDANCLGHETHNACLCRSFCAGFRRNSTKPATGRICFSVARDLATDITERTARIGAQLHERGASGETAAHGEPAANSHHGCSGQPQWLDRSVMPCCTA
jgi:hypothetical protein